MRIPTNKARQGRLGVQVLFVLVFGIALAGVVWIAVEYFGSAITIESETRDQPGAVEGPPVDQPLAEPDTIPGPAQ